MANNYSLDLELSSSQYASIADGDQTGLDLSTDFTFEAWIKLEQLPSTAGTTFTIISKYTGVTATNAYLWIISSGDDRMDVFYSDGSTNTKITCTGYTFAGGDVGTWRHIAVAVDISGKTGQMYVDSVAKTTAFEAGTATTIQNTAIAFSIGSRIAGTPDLFFDGLVDEARVWSDIRTGGEVSANYLRQISGSEANLEGYWRLNNNYLDQTSNDNDLTASGSPVFSTDVPFGGSGFLAIL